MTSLRWALLHELRDEGEPTLNDILARLSPADLIIVEGYKREPIPKIEVRRSQAGRSNPLTATDSTIIAVAADHLSDASGRSFFSLDDVGGIADFLTSHFGLEPGSTRPAE